MNVPRLAIVSTHPIQYYAPLFQALARSAVVHPRVFFTWSQAAGVAVADPGFGQAISWDIPLLEGYEYEFVPNIARRPGTEHFFGLKNPGLNRTIEAWRPDAVLVFGWNSEAHLRALLHFKGRIPVFFRGDSTLLDRRPGWRTWARRKYLTWVYRHIDVALAVGSNNRDYYRWCGVSDRRIAFAPHAVATERFADPHGLHSGRAMRWRRELGIEPGSRTLLFAGKLQHKKDPLLLLDAFLVCGAAGDLIFVGNGALEPALRSRAQGRRNVHFLPFQNQQAMPAVYRLGDVFVLPSRGPGETWGLAINEAMASGRPVIASTKAGGARDLLKEGANGWTFESGNVKDLAGALHRVLTCPEPALHAISAAAEREGRRWCIAKAARGIEDAVLNFINASREANLSFP